MTTTTTTTTTTNNDDDDDLTSFLKRFSNGEFVNIVVLTGAGVSTASGVPDFRTPDTGLFDWVRRGEFDASSSSSEFPELRTDPELVFTRSWFSADPARDAVRRRCETSLTESLRTAVPNAAHDLCAELARHGRLRRVYTQNVDGLHSRVLDEGGISRDLLVEAHGSVRDGDDDDDDRSPPAVVYYGDDLPDRFFSTLRRDFPPYQRPKYQQLPDDDGYPDLVLVLGSALQVVPFCAIPNLPERPRRTCRVLVTKNAEVSFRNGWSSSKRRNTAFGHSPATYVKGLAGHKYVSLKSKWGTPSSLPTSKYDTTNDCSYVSRRDKKELFEDQYVFDMDVVSFSQQMIDCMATN